MKIPKETKMVKKISRYDAIWWNERYEKNQIYRKTSAHFIKIELK